MISCVRIHLNQTAHAHDPCEMFSANHIAPFSFPRIASYFPDLKLLAVLQTHPGILEPL